MIAIGSLPKWLSQIAAKPVADSALIPETVGDWKMTEHWHLPDNARRYQEYGQYQRNGIQATLSYDRHALAGHNAFNCFFNFGHQLQSSSVRTIGTVDGEARFNVGYFSENHFSSLVAAGQCFAQGCIENPPPTRWGDLVSASFLKNLVWYPSYDAIPINLSIVGIDTNTSLQTVPELESALDDFMHNLNLNAVRQQAAREAP